MTTAARVGGGRPVGVIDVSHDPNGTQEDAGGRRGLGKKMVK